MIITPDMLVKLKYLRFLVDLILITIKLAKINS